MADAYVQQFNVVKVVIPNIMMEITTTVGCKINCKFCPQKTLLKAYKNKVRKLSFDNFKIALDKLPKKSNIIFSGFAEPFLNKECTNMILHANDIGHLVSVFTTGIGMKLKDVKLIHKILFSEFPHGGFVLHLPDNEGYANIKVDSYYLRLLFAIRDANFHNLRLRTMGTIHAKIQHVFPHDTVKTISVNSRAGNLTCEGITASYHPSSHKHDTICGRDEYIYNNVMLPNGDVVLCCQDFGMKHVLGNIFNDTYADIMPSPLASYALCKSCHNAIELPINFPGVQFATS